MFSKVKAKDVGIVYIRKNGKTYTKWHSQYCNENTLMPFANLSKEQYISEVSINILKTYHDLFGNDIPVAVVKVKKLKRKK
jgi:hypothetical protein